MKKIIFVICILYSLNLYCDEINKKGLLEFNNNLIKFKLSRTEFSKLNYNEKVEILTQNAKEIIDYVSGYIHNDNIRDVISSLTQYKNNQIKINKYPDKEIEDILNKNIAFSTNLKQSFFHNKLLKNIIDELKGKLNLDFEFDKIAESTEGFTDTQVINTELGDYRKKYIKRALMYHDIANAIINITNKKPKSESKQMAALLDWTYINIAKNASIFDNYDFNDLPLYLMIRGSGCCDRSAWVLTTLAYHLGLEAHLIYLYKSFDAIESFHTVAEIKVDGKWYVYDPYNYKIYKDSIYNLAKKDETFKYSVIFLNSLESRSLLPIMKLIELVAAQYIDNQSFFFNVNNSLYSYISIMSEFKSNKKQVNQLCKEIIEKIHDYNVIQLLPLTIRIARWDYPFRLKGYYSSDLWTTLKINAFPVLSEIEDARLNQLIGKYDNADKIFLSLLETNDTSDLVSSEIKYFIILNSYYEKKYEDATEKIDEYLEKYPNTKHSVLPLKFLYTF